MARWRLPRRRRAIADRLQGFFRDLCPTRLVPVDVDEEAVGGLRVDRRRPLGGVEAGDSGERLDVRHVREAVAVAFQCFACQCLTEPMCEEGRVGLGEPGVLALGLLVRMRAAAREADRLQDLGAVGDEAHGLAERVTCLAECAVCAHVGEPSLASLNVPHHGSNDLCLNRALWKGFSMTKMRPCRAWYCTVQTHSMTMGTSASCRACSSSGRSCS